MRKAEQLAAELSQIEQSLRAMPERLQSHRAGVRSWGRTRRARAEYEAALERLDGVCLRILEVQDEVCALRVALSEAEEAAVYSE